MQVHEIENWALQIIDRVKQRQRIEDSRVEAKSEWPNDAAKAARRIAGHANAVRAEYILWLIGVNDKQGTVVGVNEGEFSSWWAQVSSQFDGLAPALVEVAVPSEGKTVFALWFDSTRRPYVVKNPAGGAIGLEVPWREGTRVRSARREDLIRILSPLERQPEFDLQRVELWGEYRQPESPETIWVHWYLRIYGYLYVKPGSSFVIPFHTAEGTLETVTYPKPARLGGFTIMPRTTASGTMDGSEEQLIVEGPGGIRVFGNAVGSAENVTIGDDFKVRVLLRSREIEHPILIEATVQGDPEDLDGDKVGNWIWSASD